VVRIEVTHDMAALAVAVIAAWLLLRPPDSRLAAERPAPRRADRDHKRDEGSEGVHELHVVTSRAANSA